MKRKGLTLDSLSDNTDISRSALARWTSGKADPPISNTAKVADVLGVSTDWLIYGRGSPDTKASASHSVTSPKEDDGEPMLRRRTDVLSVDLLQELSRTIQRVYAEENARITSDQLVLLVAENYNRLITFSARPDVQRSMIPIIAEELRSDLQRPDIKHRA